jgi:predicted Mrr-cat superfamily restriction endonuclease
MNKTSLYSRGGKIISKFEYRNSKKYQITKTARWQNKARHREVEIL